MARLRKKFFISLGVLVLALVLLILFLPALLSTGAGRNFALKQVNKRIPGTLEVEDWSLSWKKAIELKGMVYREDEGGLNARVASVKVAKGLWPLAMDPMKLGVIIVEQPDLEIRLPEAKEVPVEPEQPKPKPGGGGGSSKPSAPIEEEPLIPPLEANLKIVQGRVKTLSFDGSTVTEVLKDLNLTFDVLGSEQVLAYDVEALAGLGDGAIKGKGRIELPPAGVSLVEQLKSESTLSIKNWVLDDTSKILAARFAIPEASGRLQAEVSVVGSLSEGMDIQGQARAEALRVIQPGAEPVAFGDIKMDVDADYQTSAVKISTLNLTSSFCNVQSSGTFGGDQDGTFQAKAQGDLGRVALLLDKFNLLPKGMQLGGMLDLTAEGSTREGKLLFDTLDGTIVSFYFQQDDQIFKEPRLHVEAEGSADLKSSSLMLTRLDAETTFGEVKLSTFNLGDWTKAPATLTVHGGTELNVAALLSALDAFVELPEDSKIAAGLKAKISYAWPEADQQQITVNADVTDLLVDGPDWPKINEKQIRLMGDLALVSDTNKLGVTIKKLFIASIPLSLDMKGAYQQDGEKRGLQAEGEVGYELSRLMSYFKDQVGMDLSLKGKHQKPFKLTSNWEGEDWTQLIQNATISAELQADELAAFGVKATALNVPLSSRDGVTEVKIGADLNYGSLALYPKVDFNQEKPFIVFPPELMVIDGMKLDNGLADQLLGKVHPIFHKASVTRGAMDFLMHHFKWPLDQDLKKQAAFAGDVEFADLKIEAKGMMYDIMSMAKMKEREVEIDHKGFSFELKDGRIESSPLEIEIDDHLLILAGSMGLDETLDYYVELPVTKELIGEKYIKYAEGVRVRVPITGTVSKPKIDFRALDKIIAEVAIKAGKSKLQEELGGKLGEKLSKELDKNLEGKLEEKASELLKDLFK